ncbi:MAG: polysaccharide biosynthesis/export family protein [Candidatus Riflebacteria bacterium]|nr:polysaccharide biosynthesis/export family protein [Candidatus Riflebacteria bacterium]
MRKIKWLLFIIISLFGSGSLLLAAQPGIIGAGDFINIWVKGEPELSVRRQVGKDGSISMPLIGNVGVNGMRTTDAARLIADMLEDGYLISPLVQVMIKGKGDKASEQNVPETETQTQAAGSVPASAGAEPSSSPVESGQLLVEVVDAISHAGISGVAMMLGNRIYQSNRLGQVLIEQRSGHVIIIADGFQTLSGKIEEFVKSARPAKIAMRRVKLADSITFNVVDAFTKQPLKNVEVVLDDMKIKTNNNGSFKVTLITKEFGEISLKRKGYRTHRQVVDFKRHDAQTVMLVRDE